MFRGKESLNAAAIQGPKDRGGWTKSHPPESELLLAEYPCRRENEPDGEKSGHPECREEAGWLGGVWHQVHVFGCQ